MEQLGLVSTGTREERDASGGGRWGIFLVAEADHDGKGNRGKERRDIWLLGCGYICQVERADGETACQRPLPFYTIARLVKPLLLLLLVSPPRLLLLAVHRA